MLSIMLIFTLCLVVAPTSAQENDGKEAAAFNFPDDRAGTIAEAFITTFNSGEQATVSDFLSTYTSEERREEMEKELWAYKRLFELLGTLTPQSVVDSKEADIVVLVRSEAVGSYFNVGISLDEGAPAMLDEHFIRPGSAAKRLILEDTFRALALFLEGGDFVVLFAFARPDQVDVDLFDQHLDGCFTVCGVEHAGVDDLF